MITKLLSNTSKSECQAKYALKAIGNKYVFSLHLKIANDWISRNSTRKLVAEKDLSPKVTIKFN